MLKTTTLAALLTTLFIGTASAAPSELDHRDETTAQALSVGGSVLGVVGLLAGIQSENPVAVTAGVIGALTGPAWGHYYADDYWTAGTGLRLAGMGAFSIGAAAVIGNALTAENGSGSSRGDGGGGVLMLAGLASYAVGVVHDIATADDAARAFNNAHQLTIAPTAITDAHGQMNTGFAVTGRF